MLVAAGALKSAATLFRQAGLPDAAAALVAACKEGDVPLTQAALESGELANLFSGGQPAVQRYNSAGERLEEGAAGSTGWGAAPQGSEGGEGVPAQHNTSSECSESNETAKEFQLYVCEVLCQL